MERSPEFLMRLYQANKIGAGDLSDVEIMELLDYLFDGAAMKLTSTDCLRLCEEAISRREDFLRPGAIELLSTLGSPAALKLLRAAVSDGNTNTTDIFLIDALHVFGAGVTAADFLPFLDLEKSKTVRQMAVRVMTGHDFETVCADLVRLWDVEHANARQSDQIVSLNLAYMIYRQGAAEDFLNYIREVEGDDETMEEKEALLSMLRTSK